VSSQGARAFRALRRRLSRCCPGEAIPNRHACEVPPPLGCHGLCPCFPGREPAGRSSNPRLSPWRLLRADAPRSDNGRHLRGRARGERRRRVGGAGRISTMAPRSVKGHPLVAPCHQHRGATVTVATIARRVSGPACGCGGVGQDSYSCGWSWVRALRQTPGRCAEKPWGPARRWAIRSALSGALARGPGKRVVS
jgi:hypothetical protein